MPDEAMLGIGCGADHPYGVGTIRALADRV
jgi:hypothetical protein